MGLSYPHFQVNFGVYPDTGGEDAPAFARLLEAIEVETDARFVLTPQLPDIQLITKHTGLAVIAPAIDTAEPGRGVGETLPETVADAGADGVIINHAENHDTLSNLIWKTERCRDLDLDSVACVDSIKMGYTVAEFGPDPMIYEMPEDISSDRTITRTHPDRVRNFMSMIERKNPRTHVLVGDGTSTTEDAHLALEQGGHATGAVLAVLFASEPEPLLRGIATSFP